MKDSVDTGSTATIGGLKEITPDTVGREDTRTSDDPRSSQWGAKRAPLESEGLRRIRARQSEIIRQAEESRAIHTEGIVSRLGVVVVEHRHEGAPLYVRYAHLDKARMTAVIGTPVLAGDCLGYLGDYTRGDGGDHLHFDMCLDRRPW